MGIKTIVVEDDDLTAKNLRYMLQAQGHKVPAVFASGEEAIKKTEGIRPDLVLMDINLAGDMNGIEAAKYIEANFNIPVVFLTAEGLPGSPYRTELTEAYGHLMKPFNKAELESVIETALYRFRVEQELLEIKQRETLAYELGRQLTTVLDPTNLLNETVNRLRETFNYYHAHVYLLEEVANDKGEKEWQLVVKAGTGEAGTKMLQDRHHIPLEAKRSLVAQAARSRQPVAVNDVSQDPHHLPNELLPETRSEVAMPLLLGDRLIGVLDVQHTKLDHFDADETRTLQIIASQLSVALSNAELFAENARKAERLKILRDIDQAILAAQSAAEIATATLQHIQKLIPCLWAGVTAFNLPKKESTLLAQRGGSDSHLGRHISLEKLESVIEQLEQGEIYTFDDTWLMAQDSTLQEILKADKVRAYFSIPLMAQNELIGGLILGFAHQMIFTAEEADIAREVANVLAVAIQQARQSQALREAKDRYQSLFNGVPVGLYRTEPSGKVLDVNPAMVDMLGYPNREALLATNIIHAYVLPEDRRRWQAIVEKEDLVQDFEVRLRRGDGTTVWVRNNARAVRDKSGNILYYEGALVA